MAKDDASVGVAPTARDDGPGGVASAQAEPAGNRVQLWREARRRKAEDVREPERSAVEAGMYQLEATYFIERLQAGWYNFHPVFGGLPTGSGLALGFRFIDDQVGSIWVDDDAPNRVDVAFGGSASIHSYALVDGQVALRNIGAVPVNVRGSARYRNYPREDFFGIGPGSLEDDRTTFLLRDAELGAEAWWQRPGWLRVGGGVAVMDSDNGRGTDELYPSIEDRFTDADAPGLGSDLSFLRSSAFVEVDWRDSEFNPRSGGFYAFRASWWDERGDAPFDFRQYEFDIHQYFPFLNKHRVIALRAHGVASDTDAGQQVPFYLQSTLGGSRSLRGFTEVRFRDVNAVLATAEYRWEAWIGLDMALFVDFGKVFEDHGDIFDLDGYLTGYGLGFRFNTAEGVFFRLDLANSNEGFKAYLTFDHVF